MSENEFKLIGIIDPRDIKVFNKDINSTYLHIDSYRGIIGLGRYLYALYLKILDEKKSDIPKIIIFGSGEHVPYILMPIIKEFNSNNQKSNILPFYIYLSEHYIKYPFFIKEHEVNPYCIKERELRYKIGKKSFLVHYNNYDNIDIIQEIIKIKPKIIVFSYDERGKMPNILIEVICELLKKDDSEIPYILSDLTLGDLKILSHKLKFLNKKYIKRLPSEGEFPRISGELLYNSSNAVVEIIGNLSQIFLDPHIKNNYVELSIYSQNHPGDLFKAIAYLSNLNMENIKTPYKTLHFEYIHIQKCPKNSQFLRISLIARIVKNFGKTYNIRDPSIFNYTYIKSADKNTKNIKEDILDICIYEWDNKEDKYNTKIKDIFIKNSTAIINICLKNEPGALAIALGYLMGLFDSNKIKFNSKEAYQIISIVQDNIYSNLDTNNETFTNIEKIRIFAYPYIRSKWEVRISDIIRSILIIPVRDAQEWNNYIDKVSKNLFDVINKNNYLLLVPKSNNDISEQAHETDNDIDTRNVQIISCDNLNCPFVKYFPNILIDHIALQYVSNNIYKELANQEIESREHPITNKNKEFGIKLLNYLMISRDKYLPTFIHLFKNENNNQRKPLCYIEGNKICEACVLLDTPFLCAIFSGLDGITSDFELIKEEKNNQSNDKNNEITLASILKENGTKSTEISLKGIRKKYLIIKKFEENNISSIYKIRIYGKINLSQIKYKNLEFIKNNVLKTDLFDPEVNNDNLSELRNKIHKIFTKSIKKKKKQSLEYINEISDLLAIREHYKYIFFSNILDELGKSLTEKLTIFDNVITIDDFEDLNILPSL